MAFIHTDTLTIKISKLLKGNPEDHGDGAMDLAPVEVCEQLEALLGELLGDQTIVVDVTKS